MNRLNNYFLWAFAIVAVILMYPAYINAQVPDPSNVGSFTTATDEIMQQIDPNYSPSAEQPENGEPEGEVDESDSKSEESGIARFLTDEVGLILILGAGSAVWVLMLIDALKRPSRTFPGTGTKTVWEIGILVTWLVGALVYYFVVYRKNQPKVSRRHLMET